MSAQRPFQSRVGRNGIVLIPSNLVKHRVHAQENPSRSCLKSTMSDATVHQELPWQFDLTDSAIKAEHVQKLLMDGYVIIDNAIDANLADRALAGAEMMSRNGKLKSIQEQILLGREDQIMVLDVWDSAWGPIPENFQGMAEVCRFLKGAAAAVMRHGTDGRWGRLAPPPYMQLAVYAGAGAKYVRHVDNDPLDAAAAEGPPGLRIADRAVTALLYFNKDWRAEDGGALRIYRSEPGREEETLLDVAPEAGRLVLFDSRRFFHEVLPAYRRRWALSAWIVGEGLAAG